MNLETRTGRREESELDSGAGNSIWEVWHHSATAAPGPFICRENSETTTTRQGIVVKDGNEEWAASLAKCVASDAILFFPDERDGALVLFSPLQSCEWKRAAG